ncbi:MAG: hypothetical protein QXR81_08160 [Candidatus Nezhaarchaeales archaeon]
MICLECGARLNPQSAVKLKLVYKPSRREKGGGKLQYLRKGEEYYLCYKCYRDLYG